jgi:hypothetical protein
MNLCIKSISSVTHHLHQIIPPIQVTQLMNYNTPHAFVAINYVPKLGEFGVLLNLFYIFFSFLLVYFLKSVHVSHVPSRSLVRLER